MKDKDKKLKEILENAPKPRRLKEGEIPKPPKSYKKRWDSFKIFF